jgi:hypothetical protein
MVVSGLESFPDESRLWIYESEVPVDDAQIGVLQDRVGSFLIDWVAHGSDLRAGWELRYNRFLMIAVDESQASASGCSIDSMTRFLKSLGGELEISFLERNAVSHREGDEIVRSSRAGFKDLAASGTVDGDTVVFDNTVASLGGVRKGDWEIAASRSWHSVLIS